MPRNDGLVRFRGGRMDRREFMALIGAGAAGLVLPRALLADDPPAGTGRPNIIVIVSDDQGYADVGVQGCKDIPTPNLDSLARNGVRFTSGYVSCPVCSPTRAGLMTGRYQQRFGHEFNPGSGPAEQIGLPIGEVTLADALKDAGYATGLVGKWHLGAAERFRPLRRGFDEFFGFLGGSHSYLDLRPRGRNAIFRGAEPVDEKEYLTDALSREAVAFIHRHRAEPFFLYLTYNAVHLPLQATAKYLDRFGDIKDVKRRTYAAMLSAMDDGIGAALAKLRQEKLLDNTLVFFFSDNGGPTRANGSNNSPLRGVKGQVYEGGIRVPFMVQWPGRVPAGKVYEHPVISLDVFPTAVAAAAGKLPQDRVMDGVDLLPYLTGRKDAPPHPVLYWRYGQQRAVRRGKWKLVKTGRQPAQLYDLATDVGETKDLTEQDGDVLKELDGLLAKWDSRLAKPLWSPGGARRPGTRPAPATRPA